MFEDYPLSDGPRMIFENNPLSDGPRMIFENYPCSDGPKMISRDADRTHIVGRHKDVYTGVHMNSDYVLKAIM